MESVKMKAVAVHEPGKVGIVEIARPVPRPYEVLVRSEIAFICNATDRKVVQGHFPGMGADAYPLILGHETVGISRRPASSSFSGPEPETTISISATWLKTPISCPGPSN